MVTDVFKFFITRSYIVIFWNKLYKNTSNPFNEILLDLKGGEGMSELKELVKKIEDMRNYLNDLLIEKGNLLDEEVILVSQALDKILNDYNEIISKM